MIRVIKRCLSKSELKEYKWDNHIAFMHFGFKKENYKNTYMDGKPLKWHNRLRKDATIEFIKAPEDFGLISLIFVALLVTHPVLTVLGTLAVIGIVGLGIAGLAGAFSGQQSATAGGTSQKEYSSSTQPELKGASNDIATGIIPVVFGKTQQTPSYGQLPYRLLNDGASTNKFRQYFVANYSNVVYSDFKLGETSINDYSVDYLDITTSLGGDTFIGFENVKAVNVDEQLSYDSEGQVDENSTYNYNQSAISATLKIDFQINFTNVDIANWGNKTFRLTANIMDSATPHALTQDFTIASGDLVLVSGTTYKYIGTKTWTQSMTTLVSTTFAPTALTRTNSTENTNELNCVYATETITAGTYSGIKTLNQSINRYNGTVSEVVQTTPVDTIEVDVITSFNGGLYHQNTDGSRASRTVKIEIEYKPEGGEYQPISSATSLYVRDINGVKQPLSTSSTTVAGATVSMRSPADLNLSDQLFFRPIGMVLPKGRYSIRVRSADFADKTNYDIGDPSCAEMQFRVDGDIIDTTILPKVNQIAFEATAYKGLSGTIKKFNYVAEAQIPIWNGTDWNTIDKTTNPASIIRHLLIDPLVNPRAISVNFLDDDTLVELYEWCEVQGFKASGIITDETKISDIISTILANCQASMIPLLNGKHTFVIDKPDKTPIGLFNQHNSFDFKWYPTVGRQTEAIRASFTSNVDYTTDELTVYFWSDKTIHETPEAGKTDDDYEIVKKEYKYVNDRACVLKVAEYDLTLAQQKRNNFEFAINLEALNMALLDRCYISNSTNMQNESTGLIKDLILSEGNLTGFVLYSEIEISAGSKIIIRSLDYTNECPVINIYDVLSVGNTNIVNIAPVVYDGIIKGAGEITGLSNVWHYDGDLFALGQDTIYDCTITDIKYNEDNTATITARDY